MNKYNNKKTFVDGICFDSKGEAQRYSELLLLQKAKEISDLKCQVKFEIIPKNGKEQAAYYIADFYYIENGKEIVEDYKSKVTKTPAYILKRKLFKLHYPDYVFKEVY